jgi:hypothetical protein
VSEMATSRSGCAGEIRSKKKKHSETNIDFSLALREGSLQLKQIATNS